MKVFVQPNILHPTAKKEIPEEEEDWKNNFKVESRPYKVINENIVNPISKGKVGYKINLPHLTTGFKYSPDSENIT